MKEKVFLVGFIILALLGGNSCKKEMVIPDELIGVWETSEPKYEGCYFEVTKDEIIIKDIEENLNFYKITKIEAEKDPSEEFITYVITYIDLEERDYEFPILYFPGEEGAIRWKNQTNIVWTKREAE